MPVTSIMQKATLEDSVLIFGTYAFLFSSAFHNIFMLRFFFLDKGFPDISLLFSQYSLQVSREVTH